MVYILNPLLFQCRHSGRVCNELDNLGCVGADGHGACMAGDDGDVKELFDRAINAEPFGAGPFGQINDLDAAPWFAVDVFQLLIQRQPFKAFVARLGQADIGKAVADGVLKQRLKRYLVSIAMSALRPIAVVVSATWLTQNGHCIRQVAMADLLDICHLDGPVTVVPNPAVWQPFNSIDTTS